MIDPAPTAPGRTLAAHGTPARYRWELRHGGETCPLCRAAHVAAVQPYQRTRRTGRPVGRPPGSPMRDQMLADWDAYRRHSWATFRGFASAMGIKYATWERTFYKAKAAGDPRAVRGRAAA